MSASCRCPPVAHDGSDGADLALPAAVTRGRAGDEIVAQTEEDHDAVLLGARGASPIVAIVRSVSRHVLHHSLRENGQAAASSS